MTYPTPRPARSPAVVRFAGLVFVFCAGAIVGNRIPRDEQPVSYQLRDHTRAVEVRRGDDRVIRLVPYAVCRDGRTETVGEKGAGPMWVMWLDGARLQVAYTEESEQR